MYPLLDCFSRGLLREALGQLAGLKRRKLALEMLGAAIQAGLDKQDAEDKGESDGSMCKTSQQKRKVEVNNGEQPNANLDEPKAKKMRIGTSSS